MSESASLNRAFLKGESAKLSQLAENNRGKKHLWNIKLLESYRPTGPVAWLILFSVVITATSALLTWRKTDEPGPQISPLNLPESAVGMASLLRDKLPGARIISTRADGQIDRSFILTVRGWDEETLRSLPRVSDRVRQWRGTVLCERLVDWQPAELFLEQWGEYGFAAPPFVFFGDKEFLAQIKEALR